MPFTLAAWAQSVNPAGVFVSLNAVPDQILTITNVINVLVPPLNRVIAHAAGVETTAAQQARLTAPSRRVLVLQRVAPTQGNAAAASLPGDPHKVNDLRASPLPMVTGEATTFDVQSTPAAAQAQWGLVWFADGPIAPVAGNMFTARATGTTVLGVLVWTLVPFIFAEALPRGRYQVVGLRAQSAGLIAARLVFAGGPSAQAPWRPGVVGTNTDRHLEHPMFRYGQLGNFGEFEDTAPPQVECLSTTADAAETFYLDLIQSRSGPG